VSLQRSILSRSSAQPLIRTPESCFTVSEVIDAANSLRAQFKSAPHRRAAIHLRDPAKFVVAILALDGVSDALLLIPSTTPSTDVFDFCRRVGVTTLVTDSSLMVTAPTDTQVLHWHHMSHFPFSGVEEVNKEESQETEWILTTSGTTDSPKLVPHRISSLVATVKSSALRGRDVIWGLVYDPARFAGLQVVLQSLLGGSTLAATVQGTDTDKTVEFFARAGVNALSATPTLWRKLLIGGQHQLLDLKTVTLGGEIADAGVLRSLRAAFPNARIRHVYASTEAGVGFSVTDGEEGFPASWLASPPDGIALTIRQDGLSDKDGELLIRSARSATQYHEGASLIDEDGWIATGDRVQLAGARVVFLGRMNGSINVGGDKVFPEQVENVLNQHPHVAAASVRSRRNPIVGSLVEAHVVLTKSTAPSDAIRNELLSFCREKLSKAAVPAFLRFVDRIESTTSGKQSRTNRQ
jgi:acyl-coenzyme A synthetase/AMP-(fatty) acid ligase